MSLKHFSKEFEEIISSNLETLSLITKRKKKIKEFFGKFQEIKAMHGGSYGATSLKLKRVELEKYDHRKMKGIELGLSKVEL